MEKSELVRKYELVVIVDAKLTQEEKETIYKEATDAVTKGGAKIINNHVWLEKHKFTFRIKKCHEGTYYLIAFEGEGSEIEKIKSVLRVNERVLRFAITQGKSPYVVEAGRI
ncbi:MAG TPA: 30S ribosomal protein S6 [Candidatus Omnitrophica bacterium]|nr:MAG: 30S ribosomal protein S6 [Omnitrophica WOR_2 bacterium GWA2_45_18]OGX18382.1 MAG: 30S ribosomal protein S6 [Omnitrophica WOR_2 bacterium GWC2_45_7]HBR14879.1 30S ribosomal protein S6 [Candidatus Omnitrophota bacterium]